MSKISDSFLKQASSARRRVAIGIMRPIPETVESLKKASKYADIVVVGAKVDGFENIIEPDQDKASGIILDLLKSGKVDGIVRGQVKDTYTLDMFFKKFNKEPIPSNRKVGPAVMEKGEYSFVLSTCSIYQGMTLEDKIFEVERTIKYMRNDLKIEPKIGIMSSLRPASKTGKYESLDKIAEINKQLTLYLISKGYNAKEYYFEYETAVWDKCNFIVPSTGLVGNAWLKALLYLGGWTLLSCHYLDLGVAYEDGSRNETDYYWHIVHCVAMINAQK